MAVIQPYVRRYLARLSVVILVLVLIGLSAYSFGEAGRRDTAITAAVDHERARTDKLVTRLERQIRADCRSARNIAELPEIAQRMRRPVSPVLVKLAIDAREEYKIKQCPEAGFGPAPPVFSASPASPPG